MIVQRGNMEMPTDHPIQGVIARHLHHAPFMRAPPVAQHVQPADDHIDHAPRLWVAARTAQHAFKPPQTMVDQAAKAGHDMQADQSAIGFVAMHDKVAFAILRLCEHSG